MFTGIIECVGRVSSISRGRDAFALGVEAPFAGELAAGESVAVNGACLTVTRVARTGSGLAFFADVSPETMRRTAFASFRVGSSVNLERAMRLGDRLGGHIVLGHVDGTARILAATPSGTAQNVQFAMPAALGAFMAEKGSVAIDGVSLTVADVRERGATCVVSVAVIPHTWANTALREKRAGDLVNVECDALARYVRRFMQSDALAMRKETKYE